MFKSSAADTVTVFRESQSQSVVVKVRLAGATVTPAIVPPTVTVTSALGSVPSQTL